MKDYCKLTLFLLFLTAYNHLYAQDVIVKRDGSEIEAKVVEVGSSEVRYYKFGTTSPVYSIKKNEVFMIRYENGSKDVFKEESPIVNTRTNQPASFTISADEVRKTKTAATVGYILTVPLMGLGIAAGLSEDAEVGIPLGAAATVVGGVGIPLIAGRAKRTRTKAGVDGNPGMRIAGWIGYGLAMGDAVVLIGLSASDVDVPSATTISVAALGSLAAVFMALDASETARQAEEHVAAYRRVQPFLGSDRDVTGKYYQTIGVRIKL